jgi:hypothetical protein
MNGACPRFVIAGPKAASSWALAARHSRSRGGGVASAAGVPGAVAAPRVVAACAAAPVFLAAALAVLRGATRRESGGSLLVLQGGAGQASPVGGALAATGAGEESGRGGSLGHGQLLNLKISSDLQKAGQGVGAAKVKADGFEPFVEAADDVEDEGAVGDGFTEVAEILRLALVEPTVVSDGEVALTEVAKVGVGVQGAHRLIPEKLGLNGEPNARWRGARRRCRRGHQRWCREAKSARRSPSGPSRRRWER